MIDFLDNTNDLNNTAPLFVDSQTDFRLQENSPAVDNGIATNAPTVDINGDDRTGDPDSGAFEYSMISNTSEIEEANSEDILVYPNPFLNDVVIIINDEYIGDFIWKLYNSSGIMIQFGKEKKTNAFHRLDLFTQEIASGYYELTIEMQHKALSKKLLKI